MTTRPSHLTYFAIATVASACADHPEARHQTERQTVTSSLTSEGLVVGERELVVNEEVTDVLSINQEIDDAALEHLSPVFGMKANSDGSVERYTGFVEPQFSLEPPEPKELQEPVLDDSPPFVDPIECDKDDTCSVQIKLAAVPPYEGPTNLPRYKAFFRASEPRPIDFSERKALVTEKRRAIDSLLRSVKATEISELWLTGVVVAKIPESALERLRASPLVERVMGNPYTGPLTVNGTEIRTILNSGDYISDGFDGGQYNSATGHYLRIAHISGSSEHDINHPAYLDTAGGNLRVFSSAHCIATGCYGPGSAQQGGWHGTAVMAIAAGDIRQGQVTGCTGTCAANRSGIAPEPELLLLTTDYSIGGSIQAIQWALDNGADVIVTTFGGDGGACDGEHAGIPEAINAAHEAGALVVTSAGNAFHDAGCSLTGDSESPSAFVVGATDDTTIAGYPSAVLQLTSSHGGISASVNGITFFEALAGVAALAPGVYDEHAEYNNAWGGAVSGTSFAAPQVAGAAILVKDWFLFNGYYINDKGRLFAALQAMTDRWGRTTGFNKIAGGGRFQMRYLHADDHPAGNWGWESTWYTLSDGQVAQHKFLGPGVDAAGASQFKAYAVFFEADATDIADIDMTIFDKDCGAGKASLGSDLSYDIKSMVRTTNGAGKALCVQLTADHVPAGQTRRVQLVMYYSGDTVMR